MAIVLDLAVVLILGVCVYAAYRRGFIEAIVKLLGSVGSIIVSLLLSKAIAPFLFHSSIKPGIVADITDKLTQASAGAGWQAAADQISNILPDFLNGMLFGGTDVSAQIRDILSTGTDASFMANEIAEKFIGPAVILLLEFLLFIVFLFVCRLVVRLVLKLFRGVKYIPVIGKINGLLGSVVGVFQAILYILLIAMAANVVILLSGDSLSYFNIEIIRSTKLFMAFYYFNPLVLF